MLRWIRAETEVILLVHLDDDLKEALRALASENRQRILLLFTDGQARTVNQVAAEVGLGQSTASEQLAVLRRAGLLKAERQAKEVYYRPDRAKMNGFLQKLSTLLTACCPPTPGDE